MTRLWITLFIVLSCKHIYSQTLVEKVPFELVKNLIFVKVLVNNANEPLNFMFDTGAGITVVDAGISQKLGLHISDTLSIGTAGKTIPSQLSEQNQIQLGKHVILDNIQIAIIDLSHISAYLKTNVDGIIGNDLLQQLITATNVDTKELLFYSFKDYTYVGKGIAYELIGLESGHLGIPFEIVLNKGAMPVKMILKIDTAADNYFTFHNETVKSYNILQELTRLKSKQGFGADATVSNNLAGKIYSADFCGKTFKNVPTVFEIDPLNSNSKRLANGLVGQAVLLNFNITYNLNDGVAYFEKRK
jgi:hypothetical protein